MMRTPAPAGHPNHGLGIGKGHIRYPRAPQLDCIVTAEMIASAKRKDSSHCMTSMAIEAVRPDAFKIAVDLQTIRFSDRKKRLRYVWLTPRLVQEAIVLWDQGREVEPFSFRLTGAHVTTMYVNKKFVSGIKTTEHGPEPVAAVVKKSSHRLDNIAKANLARQGLRLDSNSAKGHVPERVGGRRPPLSRDQDGVPFSRRRSFGLRALVR